MVMRTIRSVLLAAIASGGAAVTLLSFVPWLHVSATILCFFTCHDTKITGFEVTGITELGDGYVVAALGFMITSLAGAILLLPTRTVILPIVIVLAALGTMVITAFNALNFDSHYQEPTWALHAEVVLPIVVALCAGALLTLREHANQSDIAP